MIFLAIVLLACSVGRRDRPAGRTVLRVGGDASLLLGHSPSGWSRNDGCDPGSTGQNMGTRPGAVGVRPRICNHQRRSITLFPFSINTETSTAISTESTGRWFLFPLLLVDLFVIIVAGAPGRAPRAGPRSTTPSLWRPPRLSASSAAARTERPGDTAGEAA